MVDTLLLQRYRPLIEDWPAFCQSLARPLPTCIWTNSLRLTPEELAGLLAADGLEFKPIPWQPDGFQLSPDFKPGHHWAFLAGLYHVQESVAMLPVSLLDPQPGERVLDLCAAPGNKTAQIGVRLNNQGTVVANDISVGRMRGVRQTLERLGLVNVSTTTGDGGSYPNQAGLFDRVLVDVPCSCEGTSRKKPAVLQRIGPALSGQKNGLQKALLRRAIQLCKPGGRIVYATCTYAPEENEQVVDSVLREFGSEQVQLLPARIEGFAASPGLSAWKGQSFHPAMGQTMRVWPHQNDTGGFFIAVLQKAATGRRLEVNRSIPPPAPFAPPPASEEYLELVAERFGIGPETFEPYRLFQPNQKRIYAVSRDHRPPTSPRPDASGMYFMKTRLRYPKLSTAAAIAFGQQAARNYLELEAEQVGAYINRQEIQVTAGQSRACTGLGYVVIRHRGIPLGLALYWPAPTGGGVVESLFPKGWSPGKGKLAEA
jgi:NOL1/NOP2/sun family putative RNA methylase